MTFTVERVSRGSRARAGVLRTRTGEVPTPTFMPVGTYGAVKLVEPRDLERAGVSMILSNCYHLYLRPGPDTVAEMGGLHRFMGWPRSILTDSGGFQVYSLAPFRRITPEGVEFRSHLDGSSHFLTPEKVVQIQEALGADVIVPLDVCARFPASREEVAVAGRLTGEWLVRSLEARRRQDQLFFGIVQGGTWKELRGRCAEEVASSEVDGFAVGGLSVGEPRTLTWEMLECVKEVLPPSKPVYLMGVGAPEDLVRAVKAGVDLMDSVYPTRMARHGVALTPQGRLVVRNAAWARDSRPLDEGCDCPACTSFSRAYLRHLFNVGEPLAGRLLSLHNIRFLTRLAAELRAAVLRGEDPSIEVGEEEVGE